jgi:hypothetical protein
MAEQGFAIIMFNAAVLRAVVHTTTKVGVGPKHACPGLVPLSNQFMFG